MDEIRTRIRLYDANSRRGMFPTNALSTEAFCNPHLFDILHLVRSKVPAELFRITTNGVSLTEGVIARLLDLKPIQICLSINTVNPKLRENIMRDANPHVAVNAPRLLRAYGIPFQGSIVAWPALFDNIAETVRLLDEHEALVIRINLPGYSRYFRPPPTGIDASYWQRVVELADRLREQCRSPIYLPPVLFSMPHNRPVIAGVLRNSPAERAGLRYGDEIKAVQGKPVVSRPHAAHLLADAIAAGQPRIALSVRTVDTERVVVMLRTAPTDDLYPYRPLGYSETEALMGILLPGGFKLSYIKRLRDVADWHGARRVAVISSYLVKPLLEEALTAVGDRDLIERVTILCPRNEYLGGNIMLGDLLQVSDYITCLREHQLERPDLVVIPSSFARGWGRDLCGVSYLEIERATGIPVELLPCERIFM